MAEMFLHSRIMLVHVERIREGALIQTAAPGGNQIGHISGIIGRITVMMTPWYNGEEISNDCRLTSAAGVVSNNRLHFHHNITGRRNQNLIDFGQIFLTWNRPTNLHRFNINIDVALMHNVGGETLCVANEVIEVTVILLPGWNQPPQHFAMPNQVPAIVFAPVPNQNQHQQQHYS